MISRKYVCLNWISRRIGVCGKKLKERFDRHKIKPDFISFGKVGVGYYSTDRLMRMRKIEDIMSLLKILDKKR